MRPGAATILENPKIRRDINAALARLQEFGLLMASDRHLPSVTTLVAGRPVTGSWWSSPHGREIFAVMAGVASHPDIAAVRLINHKITYVDRPLWRALVAIGSQGAAWQSDDLPRRAKLMFARVTRDGRYLTSDSRDSKAAGEAAAVLERALLVVGEDVHTRTGKHARLLQSWAHWCEAREFVPVAMDVVEAQRVFEDAARRLPGSAAARIRFPWTTRRSKKTRDQR